MSGRQSPTPVGAFGHQNQSFAMANNQTQQQSSSNVAVATDTDSTVNDTVMEHSSAPDRSKLPESLQIGATRYVLLDLGDGGAGHVYIPSLALQKRPMPMQHTWRPRWDAQRGALFFVCLHDRARLWQLPDVQEELSSALQYKIDDSNNIDKCSNLKQEDSDDADGDEATGKGATKKKKNLLQMLTADELIARTEIEGKQRKENLRMRDDFRDDLVTMRKLASVQLDMFEKQIRSDIDKACERTTDSLLEAAETKMVSRRVWEELFRSETTERSDVRFSYDHSLMALREEEARERLAAKVKTRTGAADAFHKFERHAVDGAEELQRAVLLQDEAVARGKFFLEFSRLRLSGFMRLVSPVPGDPQWTPWSEEVKLEDAFIASKDFGLFYEPPAGEGVHRAWYTAKNRPNDQASDILVSARVDAVAMFGDFVLGLSELHRMFLQCVHDPSNKKLSWLEGQKVIDGSPLTDVFPSSLARSKEKSLIDALQSENDWKDRALATAMSVHQKKSAEREALQRRQTMQDRLRDQESAQVQSYDQALGRFTRRTGQGLGLLAGGSSGSSPSRRNDGSSSSPRGLATPQMYHQDPGFDPKNNSGAGTAGGGGGGSARMMSRADRVRAERMHQEQSAADQGAHRLEMIRAIKLGKVLTDKMHPRDRNYYDNNYNSPARASDGLNTSSRFPQQQTPSLVSNSFDNDWSKIKNEDGGLRWDSSYSRGVAIVEDDERAQFNPEFAEKSWKPFKICPAFALGTVGVSRGLFIWQVNVRISNYKKHAASPTFKVGMVSRYFGPSMEKASQRNQLLAGIASPTGRPQRAMSYWYDEQGALLCGSSGEELSEVAQRFGPPMRDGSNVTVVLDLDQWYLQFFVDQKTSGVAFKFDPVQEAEPLFPCVMFAAVGDEAVIGAPDDGVLATLSLDR